MNRTIIVCIANVIAFSSIMAIAQTKSDEYLILDNGKIDPGKGFGIGIDDSEQKRNWYAKTKEGLQMKYPGNLDWAAMFITVGGRAVPSNRPGQDFSKYNQLYIEMKGEEGGECVMVGIKDKDDPDDGTEHKERVDLGQTWQTYNFDTSKFKNKKGLEKIYVVAQFVFPCPGNNQAQIIYVKNIKYVNE